jgi:hypothetical protein
MKTSAVELSDDAFGVHNFNWGYYLEPAAAARHGLGEALRPGKVGE